MIREGEGERKSAKIVDGDEQKETKPKKEVSLAFAAVKTATRATEVSRSLQK